MNDNHVKENIHKAQVQDSVYKLINNLSNDSYISLHQKRLIYSIKHLQYFNIIHDGLYCNVGAGEGLEITEKADLLIKEAFPEAVIVPSKGDLRYPLQYEDNSFDGALCLEVFEHISDPDYFDKLTLSGIQNILLEILRILKPSAKCLLTTPNICSIHSIEKILMSKCPNIAPHHYREYAEYELKRILNEVGAEILYFNSENVVPFWEDQYYDLIDEFININMLPSDNRGQVFFIVFNKPECWDRDEYTSKKISAAEIVCQDYSYQAYGHSIFNITRDITMPISNNDDIECVLGYGFSEPEEGFVWTEKKNASLMVYYKNPIRKISFSIFPFCNEKHLSQRVYVSVNNMQTLELTLNESDSIIVPIPFDIQGKRSEYLSKYISIKFFLPDAISPSSLGLNEDVRELGVALTSILIE